jgi:hypothetical protein
MISLVGSEVGFDRTKVPVLPNRAAPSWDAL